MTAGAFPCLVQIVDGEPLSVHPLGDGVVTVGRRPSNAVQVMLQGVNAHHLQLVAEGGGWICEDRGSVGGTRLNGRPMQRERLSHGDVVSPVAQCDLVYLERDDPQRVEAACARTRRPA